MSRSIDMNPSIEDPFVVLGIAPTVSLAEVKRAYFAALRQHPPHSDPEGFRRLRKAYEYLQAPGALQTVSWTATFDRLAALRLLDEELAPRLEARQQERARIDGPRVLRSQLERVVATTSWEALLRAFSDAP